MTDLVDPAATITPIQDAGLNALFAYWRGLCRGAVPPRRSQIDPRRIEAVLPDAFIVERIAPGLARFRVAGAHLAGLMGMDVRGMPLSCLIRPPAREGFAAALARLFEEPATLDLRLVSPGGPGCAELTGRMLLLPLQSDLGDVSRALGCLVSGPGRPGRAPRRFDLSRLVATPLGTGLAAAPEHAPPARPALAGERPWLRLAASDGARLPG